MIDFKEQKREALNKALLYFNGRKIDMAAACNVSPQVLTHWFRKGEVPLKNVLLIEVATKNKVTRKMLRPDFFK